MSNDTSPSFLDLPAELRLQVYRDLEVPFKTSLSENFGLYLSCKQIKHEIDVDYGNVFGLHLQKIQNAMPIGGSIRFDIPTSFPAMLHLKLSISWARPPLLPFGMRYLDQDLRVFRDMHLSSLTLAFHRYDRDETRGDYVYVRPVFNFTHLDFLETGVLWERGKENCLIIEMPKLAAYVANEWFEVARMPRPGQAGHNVDWVLSRGGSVKARFRWGKWTPISGRREMEVMLRLQDQ